MQTTYELEASGSNVFFKTYKNLTALEMELRIAHFPGRLSVVRPGINEEVAFGSQSDVLFAIKTARENGYKNLPSRA